MSVPAVMFGSATVFLSSVLAVTQMEVRFWLGRSDVQVAVRIAKIYGFKLG